jgi:hypothetical protein
MPSTYLVPFWEKFGPIAKRISDIRDAQIAFAPDDLTTASGINLIRAEYSSAQMSLLTAIADQDQIGDFGRMPISAMVNAATRTLIDVVDATASLPLPAKTLPNAFREMAAQMVNDADSLDANAVGVSTAARGGNAGTGVVLATTWAPTACARGVAFADAQPAQFIRNEKWRVTCTVDAIGGLAAGNEQFRIDPARGFDNLDRRWRAGTGGAPATINATSAFVEASSIVGQNILTNSAFERTASNIADNWVARTGTAGVDINTTATAWDGSSAMRLVGGGTANPAIGQLTGATTGTIIPVLPDTTYAVTFWTRSNSGTVSKTITVQFADSGGTAVGLTSAAAVSISSHTTTYTRTSGYIHTPNNLTPGTVYLDIRNTGTTLAGGEEVYIDGVVVAPVYRIAPGAGGIVIVAGATQFRTGDHFDVTWTNDDAGVLLYWIDCVYHGYENGFVLPVNSAGSETIPDSLFA